MSIEKRTDMQIRTFTPKDYPAIVEIHHSQNIIWPERPRTAEAWAAAESKRNPKCKHQRWVAVVDERVVGFGAYNQYSGEYHPQRFQIDVEVLPEYQRGGIGTALYDRVMDALQAFDPRVLRADAFTHLPQGFTFLQKRGFYEAFRETPVHLEVNSFDPVPYAQLEPKLNSQGIYIKTVLELETDPDRDRKIFELYCAVDADVPHEEIQIEQPTFDEWLAWGLYDPSVLQDAYLIAVHGDDYVGLREIARYQEDEMLLGSLLGVRRDFRKRGIALAMQLRNIAYAREHGYRLLKDCTAVQNAPMQAMFNQLGFARDPEWQQCQKDIHP
jgi:GNAT superfamily N-acetyltransferase